MMFILFFMVIACGTGQHPHQRELMSTAGYEPFADAPVETLDVAVEETGAVGFHGGFNDGSYGYLVPYTDSGGANHGKVVRFDLTTFKNVKVLDVAATDAGAGVVGFSGGFQDGTYGYLVPCWTSNRRNVVRFDLATFSEVLVLDVAAEHPAAKGFHGGFQDGTYGYLVPFKDGTWHGNVVRFNLATFSDVQVLDVAEDETGAVGFIGGFNDGSYGYLVPYFNGAYHGKVVRFDLTTFSMDEVLDVAATDAGAGVVGFSGGFQDGTYGYLVPSYDSGNRRNVVRFDLATFREVLVLDVAAADASAKGFQGGFQDGTYGYLVPYMGGPYHGNVVRFNLATFSDVQVLDVAADDAGAKGFSGGFHDGSYGYLVPHSNGAYHGKVVRFNLAPPQTTTTTSSTMTSSTMTSSTTTSSTTTSSTTFLPPSECNVGYLRCPVPDGQSYTVLGSEGLGNCSVEGATSQFLSFAIGECNASITTYDDKQIYLATLIRANRGPLQIFGDTDIACSCEVVTVGDSAMANIDNLVNPTNPEEVTGLNDFEPELRVFSSDSFITPLTAGESPPLAMTNFYFEIASTSSDDNIGVFECWTAPSSNEDDSLTQVLVGTSCDAGLFGFRRLESPSKHILRLETLAFKFRDFGSVHVRCTVVRCSGDATTCGSCASARRLSAPALDVTVGIAATSFVAPASTGNGGSIMELGNTNGPTETDGLGEGEPQDVVTGNTVARAIPAGTFFIGTWLITTAA